LEKDIIKLKCYQDFIDKVFESSNQSQNDGFTKLSNKFKELIESMETIQKDIADQESQIKQIDSLKRELIQKNDKQAQNKRLIELELEIKDYMEKNKKLEKDIEDIQKKNQKKDSDTYQIKLSINNLYMKCKYKETEDQRKKQKDGDSGNHNLKSTMKGNKDKKEMDTNVSDTVLCGKLTEINERIVDLIKIYKELEP
jgi:septal ring factor EnvC (AmiA/AmiB activator)